MKKLLSAVAALSAALFFLFSFAGCMKDRLTKTYTLLKPVFMNKADVLANIKSNLPQQLKNTGKIFLYGRYIFLNEVDKGVHVIDNINPARPVPVGFINIPGNIDIAVKGNTLYADLYTDLLAIDISDPLRAKLTKLVPNVFPERSYVNGFINDSSKVIVDWIQKDTMVDAVPLVGWSGCPNCMMLSGNASSPTVNGGAFVPGIGGSMARFAVVNDYLFTVNLYQLGVLNITNTANPEKVSITSVGSNIETIYPFKEKLFIGSMNGLFIYNITNAAVPVNEGQFTHARACDPVVADDNYAYVTLRSGTFCTTASNQLDVVNVQDLIFPSLVKTYPMSNPHGLSKDGNLLFVCDGKEGLKIFDATQPGDLKLIKNIKGLETYDVIAWNKKLLVVAKNGLYQYDYSDISNLRLLSTLRISR